MKRKCSARGNGSNRPLTRRPRYSETAVETHGSSRSIDTAFSPIVARLRFGRQLRQGTAADDLEQPAAGGFYATTGPWFGASLTDAECRPAINVSLRLPTRAEIAKD
jgi:hypothetical protein